MKSKHLFASLWLAILSSTASWHAGAVSGARAFSNPIYQPVEYYAKKLLVADFNEDGCEDMLTQHWEIDSRGIVNRQDGITRTYGKLGLLAVRLAECKKAMANNTAVFSPPQYLEYGGDSHDNYDNDAVIADMNGDGAPDIVALNASSRNVSIFLNPNNGTGHFADTPDVVFSTEDSSLSGCPGRPALVTAGDFNGDKIMDVAIEYIDDCDWWYDNETRQVAVFIGDGKSNFKTSSDLALIFDDHSVYSYEWSMPFYYSRQPSVLSASPMLKNGRDQLIFTDLHGLFSSQSLEVWDVPSGNTPFTLSSITTPYATANLNLKKNGLLDIIGNGGGMALIQQIPGDLSSVKAEAVLSADGGQAVVAADFDQDGITDVATIQHMDELWIGYGDPAKRNPLEAPVLDTFRIAPPWNRNTYSMVVGNFNGDSLTKDSTKKLLDIATLGADVVTIHLNAGNAAQLKTPVIAQVTRMATAGDTVQATGQFWPATASEITGFTFTGVAGTDTQLIQQTVSRGQFTKLIAGMPDTLTFDLPDVDTLPVGKYTAVVYNSGEFSNPPVSFLVTGPVIPTIDRTDPVQPTLGQTFDVAGTAFGFDTPNVITSARLVGVPGPTMGLILNLSPGSLPGQFEILPPAGGKGHVMINLPAMGGVLVPGQYNLTLQNAKGRSNNFLVTIK